MLFDNDYITINIYELRDRTVRMIDTFTPSQYAEKKREIENPLLYINRGWLRRSDSDRPDGQRELFLRQPWPQAL